MKQRVALQDRAQLVAPFQRLERDRVAGFGDPGYLERHQTTGHRLPVADPRVGGHHHT